MDSTQFSIKTYIKYEKLLSGKRDLSKAVPFPIHLVPAPRIRCTQNKSCRLLHHCVYTFESGGRIYLPPSEPRIPYAKSSLYKIFVPRMESTFICCVTVFQVVFGGIETENVSEKGLHVQSRDSG